MNYLRRILLLVIGLAVVPCSAFAGTVGFGTGFDYSSGDYGDESTTDIIYVPFTVKYQNDFSAFKLTVPYISISTEGDVVGSGSDVVVLENGNETTGESETNSGLGDTSFSATYFLYEGSDESPAIPMIDLIGKIKIPTADEEKGLGTGEYDYYFQTDLTWIVGMKTAVFTTLGYKIYGDPEEYDLNNVFYGSLGGAYQIKKGLSTGLIYDTRQASTDSGTATSEVTVYVSKKFGEKYKTLLYGVKGFSDGSADYGIGLTLSYAMDVDEIDWRAPMRILSDL